MKSNATYVEVIKQAKSKDVSPPAHNFGELRSNVATFCALLFTLFGEGCDLYRSVLQILQILSHPFCMQNKQAYTPKVCHRITWAIIVDTRSFFDDIKLAEDFLEHGECMHFSASMLEGDFMAVKHGIKIQRHNFPLEWATPKPQYGPPGPYYLVKSGGSGYQRLLPPSGPQVPPPGTWPQPPPKPPSQPYNWRPANFNNKHHLKIAAIMKPLLTKFQGQCSVSNILTASGKWFDSLPGLDAYPMGVCWLHAIATCPYDSQCLFAVGHLKKGDSVMLMLMRWWGPCRMEYHHW
jgi:hypothetical protein